MGFAAAGFDVCWANDADAEAVAVFRRNSEAFDASMEVVVEADIWELLDNDYEFPKADVVTGGFPCQGFSLAGKRDLDDSRNRLYLAMKEVIRRVQPKVFVAENVRGLHNIAGGVVLQRIEEALSDLGYFVNTYLLNAADFGVPQRRERLFIVGFQQGKPVLEFEPTHVPNGSDEGHEKAQLALLDLSPSENGKPRHQPVRDAIADLANIPLGSFPDHSCGVNYPAWYDKVAPNIGPGQRLYNFRQDERTVVKTYEIPGDLYGDPVTEDEKSLLDTLSQNRRRKRYYVKGYVDGSPMGAEDLAELLGWDESCTQQALEELVGKGHLREREPGKYDFRHGTYNQFQRLDWDLPARTLVTNVGNPRNMLHPSEHRAPSVRECARLMSFPDSFVFGDDISPKGKYRMLGNAVPPRLARVVAEKILRHL